MSYPVIHRNTIVGYATDYWDEHGQAMADIEYLDTDYAKGLKEFTITVHVHVGSGEAFLEIMDV